MAFIQLSNATVEFPVFNAKGRSLKNAVFNLATGGAIGRDGAGHVIVRALDGVSLTIRDGERVGLVGHNGSGKTTLLRVLSSIYYPTTGRAVIEGVARPFINISLGIDPESTGRENIYIRAALMGIAKSKIAPLVDDIVEFAELGDFIEMPVRTYSSGMYLRLAFTIATVIQPEILIMDEWLSMGDANFQTKAKQRLEELVGKTSILVLASHSRPLLLNNCSRVIWLEHGKVRMDGPAKTVLDGYFGPEGTSAPAAA